MAERGGWKPRPVEEKFDTGSGGGTPKDKRDRFLPANVGEKRPSIEVAVNAEQVSRQMAEQVENIAKFVRSECAGDDYTPSGLYGRYKMPDNLLIDYFRGAVSIRSLTDPIQGVAGGEIYTIASSPQRTIKNATELSIPVVDPEVQPH